MKKILLIDVDSKIPNLALMRLSSYHKRMGHQIELLTLAYGGYPGIKRDTQIDSKKYLKVYASIIFSWNRNVLQFSDMSNVLIGGTGFDLEVELPPEVDSESEDYSLYSEKTETAYGFLTRGCIRKCAFCVVPKKEGSIHLEHQIDEIFDPTIHKRICLMDNNILAYPGHMDILRELRDRQIPVHFNSGLDIRLVTEENLAVLRDLKYYGEYMFSFDLPKQRSEITEKANLVRKYISKPWKLKMCLLVGWHSSLEEDLGRIIWCLERNILPYVMRHENCWSSDNRDFYIDIAAWANQPAFVKKMTFTQFLKRRHLKNIKRLKSSAKIYKNILGKAVSFAV